MTELIRPCRVNGRFVSPWIKDEIVTLEDSRKKAKKKCTFENPSKLDLDQNPEMKVLNVVKKILRRPPIVGVQTTWLGHSTVLFQLDGLNILTDPVFSKTVGGMTRYRNIACKIEDLPGIDVVIISHDHFDHLDLNSISRLDAVFPNRITWLVPEGTASLFPKDLKNVIELEWWKEYTCQKKENVLNNKIEIKELTTDFETSVGTGIESIVATDTKQTLQQATFVFVPSHHCCHRKRSDHNMRLWGGWVIIGNQSRVYFSGDTGYCDIFETIGTHYGPFDIAAIPIGGYHPSDCMDQLNCSPDAAVQIHCDVKAKKSIGIHWGSFMIGSEHFLEPLQLLRSAVLRYGLGDESFLCLRQGETRVFSGQYDNSVAMNNEQFYSRTKNQSSKLYDYPTLGSSTNSQSNAKSAVCVIV